MTDHHRPVRVQLLRTPFYLWPSLRVERCGEHNVPLDDGGGLVHFLVEHRVPDHPRSVLDVPQRLVEALDGSDDDSFLHVGQLRDLGEGHPARPLVRHLGQPEVELRVRGLN